MAAGGFGLLGPVEVRVDGRAVPLPGARQRLLLAVLLVNANWKVPTVRLIDELWGADLPADPRAALRTHIARLRRALGPAGRDLATLEGGYRLTVPRGRLDVWRFEDALAEAARADAEPALRLLDEALALCRGPALGEFADRPFALATAARLEELRVAAAERQAGLQLSLGLAEEAAAALQALLAEHPDREQARGLLMQALYRTGRHTEALATIRSWRRHLATELGLDPSPALQAIEQDILRHTAATPDTRGAAAAQAPPLPLPVTSFVGRDEDLVAVTGRLDRARLVTLHGPGGVGKTRLALEVAERMGGRYRDGICFCDLAAVTEPHAVVRAVATAAGVGERAFRRLDDQLVEQLAGRHLLLVLDNCEHVVQAAAVLAERLLKQTRDVTLLATSRERLEVDGEHVWQVRPLPVSGPGAPAIRLFLDRARAADPAAAGQDPDVAAVAGLCASLDGLPLAIELAAARLPGTTVSELAGIAARGALAAVPGPAPVGARRPLEALAEVATFRGDLAAAVELYIRAYDLSIGNGDFLDAAWDAVGAAAAYAYGDRPDDASRFADHAGAAAEQSRSPSALALVAWVRGEIAAGSSPGQARHHLQRAVALATSAGSRFVGGLSRVALAALDARHGDTAVALAHYERAIGEWQQAGVWTPLWVTLRTLVELLARAGAWDDAATLYGAVTAASSGAPPFGADADGLRQSASLLRQHLTGTEFRSHAGRGEQMDGSQVVQFALQAIARAATKTSPEAPAYRR